MNEKLKRLLIELSQTLSMPDNSDLSFISLFKLNWEYGQIKSVISSAIEHGLTQEHGLQLLEYAIKNNNDELSFALKQEGVSCPLKNLEQRLIEAIEKNNPSQFSKLISWSELDESINGQLKGTRFGSPLLLYALMFGNSDITKQLLDSGASVSVMDWLGNTALHCAIAGNNVDCFHSIPIIHSDELYKRNLYGFCPLHYAVRNLIQKQDSRILDELCLRFHLDKNQIIQEYKNYPRNRIDQEILIQKISKYIQLQSSKNTNAEENEDITLKFQNGLCHGLSFVFGLHGAKSRKDINDFYNTLETIASWDGSEESLSNPIQSCYLNSEYHTLGELIEQFSNDVLYFYAQDKLSGVNIVPHDRVTQYNLLRSGQRIIKPILDVSLVGMKEEEFCGILKNTLKPNTILDISGAAHTVSITCDSDGNVFFYDPGHIFPTTTPINNFEQLARFIYDFMPVAYDFQQTGPYYIGVYTVSENTNNQQSRTYPTQESMVTTYILNTKRNENLFKELELCVIQDCVHQFKYLLKSNALSEISPEQMMHLANDALQKGSFRCLEQIIKYGNLDKEALTHFEKNSMLADYREILNTLDKEDTKPNASPRFFN